MTARGAESKAQECVQGAGATVAELAAAEADSAAERRIERDGARLLRNRSVGDDDQTRRAKRDRAESVLQVRHAGV
jgi:hypothetical protein